MIPGQEYFDRIYDGDDDPWDFAGSPYERRKYEMTVAALPARSYDRAFEPGCSVGELTVLLARRCRQVVAVDRAPRAVELARRTVDRAGVADRVRLRVQDLREALDAESAGSYDLVVLSEILYYMPPRQAADLAESAVSLLAPGGTLVLVHWRGSSPDHACTGDEVHAAVTARSGGDGRDWGMTVRTTVRDRGFLLEVWERS